MPIIQTHNLSKNYGKKTVVNSLDIQILQGKVVGLIGKNGAGKSTLLKMLTTYLIPQKGELKVAGFDIYSEASKVRKVIGYLPEKASVYPDMRVKEYLKFRARIKGVDHRDVNRSVEHVMEQCNLLPFSRHLIAHLSKGYTQRVGLADALIGRPKILLLDEPMSGFDPEQMQQMLLVIEKLKGDYTIILSSHNLEQVSAICDEFLVMDNGNLICQGSLNSLRKKVKQVERVDLEIQHPLEKLKQELQNSKQVKQIQIIDSKANDWQHIMLYGYRNKVGLLNWCSQFIQERGYPIRLLNEIEPSLDAIFSQLIESDKESTTTSAQKSDDSDTSKVSP